MSPNQRLRRFVQMSGGHELDAVLLSPQRYEQVPGTATDVDNGHGNRLAVFVHPWSWLGGSMYDGVLQLLTGPCLNEGYHCLLFDSRGVGKSQGRASWSGLPEAEDLKEMAVWGINTVNAAQLLLVGYSHGSLVVSKMDLIPSVATAHLLVSYPLSTRSLITAFHSSSYAEALDGLAANQKSVVLVIYSDEDQFTGESKYITWTKDLAAKAKGRWEFRRLAGDHFWRGKGAEELVQATQGWLQGLQAV